MPFISEVLKKEGYGTHVMNLNGYDCLVKEVVRSIWQGIIRQESTNFTKFNQVVVVGGQDTSNSPV